MRAELSETTRLMLKEVAHKSEKERILQEEDAYKVKKAKVFRFSENVLAKYEKEEKDDYDGVEYREQDGVSVSERAKRLISGEGSEDELTDQSTQTVVSVDCNKVLSKELLQPFSVDEEAFMDFSMTEDDSSNYDSVDNSTMDMLEHKHFSRRSSISHNAPLDYEKEKQSIQ